MTPTDTYLMLYLSLVKELVDELNAGASAGLLTNKALHLLVPVDRETRKLGKALHIAQSQSTPQQ